ncbi:MAG: alpha/beta hydrolase, partial [Nocardioides sp.]|nr:alpha/beta hydrolase [Nocardioides sp.]
AKPADWSDQLERNAAELGRPGRMKALQRMGSSAPVDAGEQLPHVRCPALIVEGTLDPDWADPVSEGEAIVAAMPAGLARLETIEGAGHYPHTQFPDETLALVLPFLAEHAGA